jgi:hypothetical protein
LIRFRPGAVLAAVLLCALASRAERAQAAAEVHRLSLVLSGIPSEVKAGDFNKTLDQYNAVVLDPLGYEGLNRIQFAWAFGGELRYFVRPNFAVSFGASQLRAMTKREFLPAISQAVNLRGEILTYPVHAGAAYYLQPYNQGDFQARAFFGAGLVSYAYTRASLEQVLTNPDTTLVERFGQSFKAVGTQDSPRYYLAGGVHMFFALRYSVLLSVLYRTGEIEPLLDERTLQPLLNPEGKPYRLDVGGLGARFALGIGF